MSQRHPTSQRADACASSAGAKRVRAYLGGELVADTTRPLLVWEKPYYPTYYFPAADVRTELLDARRRRRPLAEPRRRAHLHGDGPEGRRRRRRPCATRSRRSRSCATRSASSGTPWTRGSRRTSRSSRTSRPLHPRGHPPELAARARRGRRRDDRGDGQADRSCSRPASARATTCPRHTSAWIC